MHGYRTKKNLWVAALALCFLTQTARVCRGQDACRADVNSDGRVTEADVAALVPVLFGELTFEPLGGTDVNDDGATTPADLTAILTALGLPCSTNPTPTATSLTPAPPTATPKPTTPATATKTPATPVPTNTATPTRTPTNRRATPTPTSACVVHQAHFGVTTDELAITDCQAPFNGQLRIAKLYSIVGTPGTAITVDMQATGFPPSFIPSVLVVDADGQFIGALGSPPLEFVVTTTRPYLIFATSDKHSPSQLGPYTLTLTSSACPTPLAIKINSSHGYSLGMPPPSLECPDPGAPALGDAPNPADLYTFTVLPAQVPLNMSILMRQSNSNDDIDPFLSLIGPDGFELANDDDSGGFVGIGGFDAEINFLAVQPGTYTIIATGGGGTGGYSLQLTGAPCRGTTLANIPVDKPLVCPGQPGPGCHGTLYTTLSGGAPPATACAAPLPMPAFSPDSPDPSSPADVYTFTASAGDVISVEMRSDDDARLYVFGPASAGNPLVAQDDNSGPLGLTSDAQLAATLPLAGTYTIVAANNNALQPGDTPVSYTLFVQKCPAKGPLLNPSTRPSTNNANFSVFDCVGYGGVPVRTYAFDGNPGQFATVTMSSSSVDAFVRLFAPDGSRVENDDDLFNPAGTDARVNQILPQLGRYFIEVSSSPAQGEVNVGAAPSFIATVRTCTTTAAVAGPINGVFQSTDCELSPGRKYDVYKFAPGAPRVASVLLPPPTNGCVVALTAEGLQTPENGCSTGLLEFPVLSSGAYGFMIAGTDANTRGAYTAQVKSCPLSTVGYGDARAGTLLGSDCADAAGAPADWFLFRAPADLVQFNSGLGGSLQAGFTPAGVLTDRIGAMSLMSPFSEDPSAMYPLGSDLAALFKVTGATPSDTGSYTLAIDPASFRQ